MKELKICLTKFYEVGVNNQLNHNFQSPQNISSNTKNSFSQNQNPYKKNSRHSNLNNVAIKNIQEQANISEVHEVSSYVDSSACPSPLDISQHQHLNDPNFQNPVDEFNGIQSTMNRKERRFFQKKELQLHTTIRKGKNTNQMYILSPDQVKFNQESFNKRFEDKNDESNTYVVETNARRPTVNVEQEISEANEIAMKKNSSSIVRNPSRKNNQSRKMNRSNLIEATSSEFGNNQNIQDNSFVIQTSTNRNNLQLKQNQNIFLDNFGSFSSVSGNQQKNVNLDQQQDQKQDIIENIKQTAQKLENDQKFQHANSQQQGPRKIDATFNPNSYINNSSVAKTAMLKRRNISIGTDIKPSQLPSQNQQIQGGFAEINNKKTNNLQNTLNKIQRPNISNSNNGNQQNLNTTNGMNIQENFLNSTQNVRQSGEPVGRNRQNNNHSMNQSGATNCSNRKQTDLQQQKYNNSEQVRSGDNQKYPNYIEELMQSTQRQFHQIGNGQNCGINNQLQNHLNGQSQINQPPRIISNRNGAQQNANSMLASIGTSNKLNNGIENSLLSASDLGFGVGSLSNHGQARYETQNHLGPRLLHLSNNNNIHDANPSYLLQKQMNSSRFGGFRTADGASQAYQVNQYLHHHALGQHNNQLQGNPAIDGFVGVVGGISGDANRNVFGPQSPQSNQSFRVNVENRRARPKIVKTSHDHGNMFFIQQANSLKNSSQIGQRKDIISKMLPYTLKQSRGGELSSQGGMTSATTALGNQDGSISNENRSGYSGHEQPNNVKSGVNNHNNQNSNSRGNGMLFGEDQTHKSISDKEITPTNKDIKNSSKMRNNLILSGENSGFGSMITNGMKENADNVNGCGETNNEQANGKGKNPYYFTFFNEKNELQKQDNNVTTENQGEGLGNKNLEDGSISNLSPSERMNGPLGQASQSQHTSQQIRGVQNNIISQNDSFTLNYSTLDQDTRRINQPIRGNHHGANGQALSQPPICNYNNGIILKNQASDHRNIRKNGGQAIISGQMTSSQILAEPTPSFQSSKQAQATRQNQQSRNCIRSQNKRQIIHGNKEIVSSQNTEIFNEFSIDNTVQNEKQSGFMQASFNLNVSGLNDSVLSAGNQPIYTPIRRNPQVGFGYQRSKPTSPKILLPQCFLDQPLNQIINQNQFEMEGSSQGNRADNQLQLPSSTQANQKNFNNIKGQIINKVQPQSGIDPSNELYGSIQGQTFSQQNNMQRGLNMNGLIGGSAIGGLSKIPLIQRDKNGLGNIEEIRQIGGTVQQMMGGRGQRLQYSYIAPI